MNLIIGSHVSFKKDEQIIGSIKEALSYGSNTFMIYTGAPQNTARTDIDTELTSLGKKALIENNIDINNIVVHAPYIINLANPANLDFSIRFLKEEINRTEILGLTKLVLHPGSHVGLGVEEGIKNIIYCLNKVVDSNTSVDICLETMAGKGTEIGRSFEELKQIIDGVKYSNKIKVCLDTCHINDAGYNIKDFDTVLKTFDQVIGLEKIACIHINDSKNDIDTHKDRHENFGFGTLGFDNLIKIIYHPLLNNIPKILETPYIGDTDESKDRLYPPYKFEIEMIKNQKFDVNVLDKIRNYYK